VESRAIVSVRKRTWSTARGEKKTTFVCDYFDSDGIRRHESFPTKAEAKKRHAEVVLNVHKGTSSSFNGTFAEAAADWMEHLRGDKRERATIEQYEQHLRLHLPAWLDRQRIRKFNENVIKEVRKHLLKEDEKGNPVRSRRLAAKAWITFKSILKHARIAHVAQGVNNITQDSRAKRKLEIGIDVPTNDEIRRLFLATSGGSPIQKRKCALLLVAAFCGLRASELRGLRWADVKLDEAELQVTQRADRYKQIGHPKSPSSRRTVPLSPDVVRALREWKLAQGGQQALVFATKRGAIESHGNMLRSLRPVMRDAGLVIKDKSGKLKAKYAMHAFRHYFASWCISPVNRGGRGLSPKVVQEWLGHSTIGMTLDIYGHLFKEIDRTELATSTASVLQG
jgi:integrase